MKGEKRREEEGGFKGPAEEKSQELQEGVAGVDTGGEERGEGRKSQRW